MKNVLIGATSSIAAYKIYELIRKYKKNGYEVKVVLSKNALNFVSVLVLESLTNNKVYFEQFAPREDVEHIALVDWADVFVLAPASANTISKISTGIADNLLTSVITAYIGSKKPMAIAPAMNCNMWENPIIQENIEKLKKLDIEIIEPETGFLACGTVGKGRLADIDLIYEKSLRLLFQDKKNNSKKIVVTVGGTREKIDSVRYITNASSGKMGHSLALWAYYLGYNVVAITTVEKNAPYPQIKVNSADEMYQALLNQEFDYLVMAAAVGDFKVQNCSDNKISKENIKDEIFELKLVKNIDIVQTIAQNKKENQKIIGFCLADNNIVEIAKQKLANKKLDFIVANDVKTALNTEKNKVTIIEKSGKIVDIGLESKENIARKILEVVCD